MNKPFASVLLALSAIIPAQAFAATPIEGIDAMREWNLIVLGDLESSSNVEGRTFVGGNLSGNSSDYRKDTPPPSANGTPGLTVVGSVTGNHKNLWGGAQVGGSVQSGFNLNGPAQTVRIGGTLQNTNLNPPNSAMINLNSTDPSF